MISRGVIRYCLLLSHHHITLIAWIYAAIVRILQAKIQYYLIWCHHVDAGLVFHTVKTKRGDT